MRHRGREAARPRPGALDPRAGPRRTARRAGDAHQPRPREAVRREDRRAARGAEGHRRASRRARAGRGRRLRARARRHATRDRASSARRPACGSAIVTRGGQPRPGGDGRIGAADERQPRMAATCSARWPSRWRSKAKPTVIVVKTKQSRGAGHLRGAARQRGHPRPRRCLRRAQPLAAGRRRQVVRREHLPRPRVRRHPQARGAQGAAQPHDQRRPAGAQRGEDDRDRHQAREGRADGPRAAHRPDGRHRLG